MRRRCGWLPEGALEGQAAKVVWARKGVMSEGCPRSAISAASEAWLELWAAWRHTRGAEEMEARDVEALALLSAEMEKETHELDRS
ncbi:MAG TPA: hypothetical protein PKJ41_03550 [Bryobacteraceae bacterium]|nr:hypothetical protein [Bryobacteraceae bacterium]